MFSQSFIYPFQNKTITVNIQSPEQPNPEKEQELIRYLKEIYLQKIKENPYE